MPKVGAVVVVVVCPNWKAGGATLVVTGAAPNDGRVGAGVLLPKDKVGAFC